MGDGLHGQANALDSAFVLDLNADYSNADNEPVRWLAEGRDPSATIEREHDDRQRRRTTRSRARPSRRRSDRRRHPSAPRSRTSRNPHWRWFWTQQHGDNNTWEVLPAGRSGRRRAA